MEIDISEMSKNGTEMENGISGLLICSAGDENDWSGVSGGATRSLRRRSPASDTPDGRSMTSVGYSPICGV
jgi:hypothetical protein